MPGIDEKLAAKEKRVSDREKKMLARRQQMK